MSYTEIHDLCEQVDNERETLAYQVLAKEKARLVFLMFLESLYS